MAEIELTKHAKKRLKERGVSLAQVSETVLAPDSWFYGEQGEINAIKSFGKRKLRVVYVSTPKSIRIITAIWL